MGLRRFFSSLLNQTWQGSYYQLTRKEYYEKFIFPSQLSDFSQFVNADNTAFTNREIQFKDLEFGISKAQITDLLGNPRYKTKFIVGKNLHKILFYKEKISDFKVITQLHFINDKLFFASYTFKGLSSRASQKISSTVYEKYLSVNPSENSKLSLIDIDNNRLSIVANVHLTITYLTGDPLLLKIVDEYSSNETIKVQSKELLQNQELFSLL